MPGDGTKRLRTTCFKLPATNLYTVLYGVDGSIQKLDLLEVGESRPTWLLQQALETAPISRKMSPRALGFTLSPSRLPSPGFTRVVMRGAHLELFCTISMPHIWVDLRLQ